MTCVSPEGRITPGCAGLWNDGAARRLAAHRRLRARQHAGQDLPAARPRRPQGLDPARLGGDRPAAAERQLADDAPSPLPYLDGVNQVPRAMTRADMDAVRERVRARRRGTGHDAGSTCSSCTWRTAICSRASSRRSPISAPTSTAARREPPALSARGVPRGARGVAGGTADVGAHLGDTTGPRAASTRRIAEIARAFKAAGADLIDVSTGQTVPWQQPVYGRM